MIDQLIENISNQNIVNFFQHNIPSFKPDREDFEYLLKDETPFLQLQKIGFAALTNDELLVFSCLYSGELTARRAKKVQYEIAKKVLKEDFKDGAIFIFYDSSGNFRFSFIRKNYGDKNAKYSSWKRFTYYVNPHKENKTFKRQNRQCRLYITGCYTKCL